MRTRTVMLVAALLILSGCEKSVDQARMECLSDASNAPTDAGVRQRVMLCHQKFPKQPVDWSQFTPVDKPTQPHAPVDWSQYAPTSDVMAQSERRPAIEDMHRVLENAVRQGNTQLANTRIDDYTTLKLMTYDRRVPVMTYHYTSTALAASGEQQVSEAGRSAMYDYHRTKTCPVFGPFMRAFPLQVTHRFEDASTGKEMITITLRSSDCPRS